jgi:CRP-like cAMP-binding protein
LDKTWEGSEVRWFSHLSGDERAKLAEASQREEHAAGEIVFEPTDSPHSVYLLEKGLVRIYRCSEDGLETLFGFVSPGEVFGELIAFGDHGRESFAQAVERSIIWKMPVERFRQMLTDTPEIGLEITAQIGERFKRIESRVENLVSRDARSRLAHILLELGDLFGVSEPTDGVRIMVPINQTQLASLVGATRQTVNASLGELESKGLVKRDGRQILIDSERMRAEIAKHADA